MALLPRAPLFATTATTNPFANLAVEEHLLRAHGAKEMHGVRPSLFLWRNSPCVVIGQHQNAYAECALDAMEKDGVTLVRRHTGGGAVYHDLGNTNFTFVGAKRGFSRERNFGVVTAALRKLGVDGAKVSGRNDITTGDGRKVSGSAYRETGVSSLHHGTMLVNADLGALQRYLTPHPLKLASKGVPSARARVANLAEVRRGIKHDEIVDAISSEFHREFGLDADVKLVSFDAVEFCKSEPETRIFYDQLDNKLWRMGQNPPLTTKFETKFDWGLLELRLDVKGDTIADAVAFTDSLQPELVDAICSSVKGIGFTSRAVNGALRMRAATIPAADVVSQLYDVIDWITPLIPGFDS